MARLAFWRHSGEDKLKKLFPDVPSFVAMLDSEKAQGTTPESVQDLDEFYEYVLLSAEKYFPTLMLLPIDDGPGIGARICVKLAEIFGKKYGKTVLLDLDLPDPKLHQLLNIENLEGVVDFFLYGASSQVVTTATDLEGVSIVTVGSYTDNPQEIYDHVYWERALDALIPDSGVGIMLAPSEGLFDLNTIMSKVSSAMLYVPETVEITSERDQRFKNMKKLTETISFITASPGFVEESLAGAGVVISEREMPESVFTTKEEKLIVEDELGRPGEEFEPAEEFDGDFGVEASEPAFGAEEPDDFLANLEEPIFDDTGDEKLVPMNEEEEYLSSTPMVSEEELFEEENYVERKKSPGAFATTLAILTIFASLLVGFLWATGYFSFTRDFPFFRIEELSTEDESIQEQEVISPTEKVEEGEQSISPREESVGEGATIAVPVPRMETLSYSIAVASFQSLASGNNGEEQLRSAGLNVYLTPVQLPGKGLWNRLLLGAYTTKSEADAALLEFLDSRKLEEGRVIMTPLSFMIGDFQSQQELQNRQKALQKNNLSTYWLQAVSSDGEIVYRLYAGAFENEIQATPMREKLRTVGVTPELVTREGVLE